MLINLLTIAAVHPETGMPYSRIYATLIKVAIIFIAWILSTRRD